MSEPKQIILRPPIYHAAQYQADTLHVDLASWIESVLVRHLGDDARHHAAEIMRASEDRKHYHERLVAWGFWKYIATDGRVVWIDVLGSWICDDHVRHAIEIGYSWTDGVWIRGGNELATMDTGKLARYIESVLAEDEIKRTKESLAYGECGG